MSESSIEKILRKIPTSMELVERIQAEHERIQKEHEKQKEANYIKYREIIIVYMLERIAENIDYYKNNIQVLEYCIRKGVNNTENIIIDIYITDCIIFEKILNELIEIIDKKGYELTYNVNSYRFNFAIKIKDEFYCEKNQNKKQKICIA